MTPADLMEITREGLYLAVLLVGPPVIASAVAGLVVAVIQTATQVQEQTVSFAARAIAVVASLIAAGPWIGAQLRDFTATVLAAIPSVQL
jgi:type III secretion HrpO family protein